MERPQKILSARSSSIIASLMQQIENLDATETPSDSVKAQIFRFPLHVARRRAADIRPRVVSIGPFYHGNPDFEGMEIKKLEFFKRIKDDVRRLSNLFREVRSFVDKARKCYSEPIDLDDYAFAQMLLIDSCFIIRFLISLSIEMEDCLVSLDWSIKEIGSDLLLLENQIPLFVVRQVYDILRTSWGEYRDLPRDFTQILGPFICMNMPWGFDHEVPLDKANHLLHYYWLCFFANPNEKCSRQGSFPLSYVNLPNPVETTISINKTLPQDPRANWAENLTAFGAPRNIPSVTELSRVAGVVFKKKLHKRGFVMRFRNGIMEMSSLKIDESRKIILTNLVGFEKSLKLSERKVSSYMSLLDSLINTEEDVALLQKYGIIFNGLINNSKAAEFFNEIGNMCTINYRGHLFESLFKDVTEYYNSTWNRRIASLHRNYFSNPWAVISVVAAGFLLLLSVIQTIFTGFQTYYAIHPHK